jgi:hypothetical protein
MRLHHGVRTLAAVVTTATTAAAVATPAAAYFDNTTYPPLNAFKSAPAHHPGDSTDWTLIGLGAAGGIAVVAVGVTGSRRLSRKSQSAARVTAASGS